VHDRPLRSAAGDPAAQWLAILVGAEWTYKPIDGF
jgi:hypothetical protein